jgi:hypothetical protein
MRRHQWSAWGNSDGRGRASETVVLSRAQARERDDRGHALLHEIIPHGALRSVLFEPDASFYAAYAENPETTPCQ